MSYRNNVIVILGVLMFVFNVYSGIYAAYYHKGDVKVAYAALISALCLYYTIKELRKPRNK